MSRLPGADLFQTRRTTVADVLRQRIAAGDLAAGTQLRQKDVAAELGVSTTPVREAFAALRREGLLVMDGSKRLVVFTPTWRDVLETYEIRTRLETLATRHAVPNLTERDIERMEAIYDELELLSGTEFVAKNLEFHDCLYQPCGMAQLLGLIEEQRAMSAAYLNLLSTKPDEETTGPAQSEHRAIIDRCRAGNADGASAAIRQHLHSTEKAIHEFLAGA